MKLKTLKDLDITDEKVETDYWYVERKELIRDLRKEAIKWIRELERITKEKDEIEMDWHHHFLDWKNQNFEQVIMFIEHFFNIKEEDLK